MPRTWIILTGEYPPALGGVSDYTEQVAGALVGRGDGVHVFAPAATAGRNDADARARAQAGAPARNAEAVRVRATPDHFGLATLAWLGEQIDRLPERREIIVQYVPHAFGMRAMNVPFCLWLLARSRRERITVIFHEVSYPIARGQPLHHNVLGAVNRAMAAMLARAATRAMVTIPAWATMLRKLGARCVIEVVPVPSNLPTAVQPCAAARARERWAGDANVLIGTFGTFGRLIAPMLDQIVPQLARGHAPQRRVVLIGRGSEQYRESLGCKDRIVATGALAPHETAAAIAACDVIVQPYPDGISGRRSSATAALALGAAVVANVGALSEPFWRQTGAVEAAPSPDPRGIVEGVERVLADQDRRCAMRRAAKELYDARFDLRHTIEVLAR